jgi:hypothetical protein
MTASPVRTAQPAPPPEEPDTCTVPVEQGSDFAGLLAAYDAAKTESEAAKERCETLGAMIKHLVTTRYQREQAGTTVPYRKYEVAAPGCRPVSVLFVPKTTTDTKALRADHPELGTLLDSYRKTSGSWNIKRA